MTILSAKKDKKMDELVNFLKAFNIQTIISLVVIVWYFNNHTEKKMEKMEERIEKNVDRIEVELKQLIEVQRSRVEAQSARSDQLYQMFIELLKEKK